MKKRGMFVQSHEEELTANTTMRGDRSTHPTRSEDLPIWDAVQSVTTRAVGRDMDTQAIAAQLRALLSQLEGAAPSESRSLAAVAADWMREQEARCKASTLKGLRIRTRYLTDRYGDRPIASRWREVAVEILQATTPSAAMHRITALASILRWAAGRGEQCSVDFGDLASAGYQPAKRRPYHVEQLRRILATLDEREIELGLITAPVIRLLVFCPMRASEACALRWEWVDIDAGRIHLPDAKTGPRVVPFGSEARRVIETQVPKRQGYVFPGHRGAVAYQSAYTEFIRTRESAGVTWGALHHLRHSWSKISAKIGIATAVRAAVLGHSTHGMTDEVYTYVDDEDLDDAVSRVEDAILGRRVETMKH